MAWRSYDAMLRAYHRIFDRCALSYVVVEAEPGQIGGDVNHEFMARADVGEIFVECANGDYLADRKAATPMPPEPVDVIDPHPLERVHTPDAATINALSALLGLPAERMLKTMLYDAGGRHRRGAGARRSRGRGGEARACAVPAPVRPFDEDDFRSRGSSVAMSARTDSTARQRFWPTTPFAAASTG